MSEDRNRKKILVSFPIALSDAIDHEMSYGMHTTRTSMILQACREYMERTTFQRMRLESSINTEQETPKV